MARTDKGRLYLVLWELETVADSPEAAADRAWRMIRRRATKETVFIVDTGPELIRVDVVTGQDGTATRRRPGAEPNPERLPPMAPSESAGEDSTVPACRMCSGVRTLDAGEIMAAYLKTSRMVRGQGPEDQAAGKALLDVVAAELRRRGRNVDTDAQEMAAAAEA